MAGGIAFPVCTIVGVEEFGRKGKEPARVSRLEAFQVSRAPPPDSGVVPFSKKPNLAN
jgi:hypothetical protein